MKARKGINVGLALLALVWMLCVGCASTRATERGAQGAVLGGGIGLLTGNGTLAWAGALIGAGLGSIVGSLETDKKGIALARGPAPLPWIQGERVFVSIQGWSSWGESLRAEVEEGLRARGGLIVAGTGRQYGQPAAPNSYTYLAEVRVERQGNHAIIQIRVIDANRVVRAIGRGSNLIQQWGSFSYSYGYNTYYDEYEDFRTAARRAITTLH